ncbi:hypothetical protein DRP04_08055 [Archaeoglobales archaeon]|nr:MAG: hypothetical protein DRP04_08055 [Archaeoglobales archaeon]
MSILNFFEDYFRGLIEWVWITFGIIGILAFFLLLLYIFFPKNFETIVLHFQRLLATFSYYHRKKYISNYIEKLTERELENINKCVKISNKKLKIIWTEEDVVESWLDKGFVIIRMKKHKNMHENLAKALLAYLPYTLPPTVHATVRKDLTDGISYFIARDISKDDPYVVAELRKVIESKYDSEQYMMFLNKLENINSESLLIRVLLPEIVEASSIVYPNKPPELNDEIEKMIDILDRVVEGNIPEPLLNGKYISFAIVRVASTEKLLSSGIESHLTFAKKVLEKGIRNIYVLAAGEIKPKWAKKLVERLIKELGLKLEFDDLYSGIYRGKRLNLYCCKLTRGV